MTNAIPKQLLIFLSISLAQRDGEKITTKELIKLIKEEFPHLKPHSIRSYISLISRNFGILKRKKTGIYTINVSNFLKNFEGNFSVQEEKPFKEEDVYPSLFGFLKEEKIISEGKINNYATKKVKNRYLIKPDIIGIQKDKELVLHSTGINITSVEVKIGDDKMQEALGQASMYKLFSNYVYIAFNENKIRNIQELISICFLNGIGLITYSKQSDSFVFDIKLPAKENTPISKYVSQALEKMF